MKLLARRSAGTIITLTLACCATETVGATPLTVAGGDAVLWAYRSLETDPDHRPGLGFAYALPSPRGLRFVRLPMLPTSGAVQQSAVRGANLHIFFEDGTHYRLRPPPRRERAARPGKNDFPELKLPDARPPVALCGDDQSDALAAIIRTSVADKIEAVPISKPATQPAEANETAEAPVPPAREPTRYTLAQYVQKRWKKACPIPTFFDDHRFCDLAAYGGTYHLFFATAEAPRELLYTAWAGVSWRKPQRVANVAPGDVLCVLTNAETVALVRRRPSSSESTFTVQALTLRHSEWREEETLRLDGADLLCPSGGTSVHRFQDRLAVAMVEAREDTEVIRVGLWPVEGGQPTRPPEEVVALGDRPEPIANEQTRMLIATVVLTLLLVIVFLRRRESFLTDLPTPPGYVLAKLGRRFTAFVIDLAIVSLMVFAAFVAPWLIAHDVGMGEDLWDELDDARVQNPDGFYWRWMAAAGLYILYGIIFEVIMAATPGKLLLHLRVRNHRGQPCALGAIIVRNLLRFELYPLFQLVPTAILVALTRNRQRLGDLVANTIVVEKTNGE